MANDGKIVIFRIKRLFFRTYRFWSRIIRKKVVRDFYQENQIKVSLKGMFNFINLIFSRFLSKRRSRQDIVMRTWETLSTLDRQCSRVWHILHVTLFIAVTHFTTKIFRSSMANFEKHTFPCHFRFDVDHFRSKTCHFQIKNAKFRHGIIFWLEKLFLPRNCFSSNVGVYETKINYFVNFNKNDQDSVSSINLSLNAIILDSIDE